MISLPVNIIHIELEPVSNPLLESSDQLSPQVIQETLKASSVDFPKFKITTSHIWPCQSGTITRFLHFIWIQSCTVNNQQI